MPSPSPLFGTVENPLPKLNPGGPSYGGVKTGLPALISNFIGLMLTIGGIAVLITFLLAGLDYITAAGDPKKIENAARKINMSLTGLVVIAAAFLIAGIAGKLLLGDYSAFLTPKLFGPGANTLQP